ncbi:MAG: hypothetical protein IPL75_08645 [Acidobacteria bacterium]|nr:hypothetical protein [Acidobacteriota bacterium]
MTQVPEEALLGDGRSQFPFDETGEATAGLTRRVALFLTPLFGFTFGQGAAKAVRQSPEERAPLSLALYVIGNRLRRRFTVHLEPGFAAGLRRSNRQEKYIHQRYAT